MPFDFKTELVGELSRHADKCDIADGNHLQLHLFRVAPEHLAVGCAQATFHYGYLGSKTRPLHHEAPCISPDVANRRHRCHRKILPYLAGPVHAKFVIFRHDISACSGYEHCRRACFALDIPPVESRVICRYAQSAFPRRMGSERMGGIIADHVKCFKSLCINQNYRAEFLVRYSGRKLVKRTAMGIERCAILWSGIPAIAVLVAVGRKIPYLALAPFPVRDQTLHRVHRSFFEKCHIFVVNIFCLRIGI